MFSMASDCFLVIIYRRTPSHDMFLLILIISRGAALRQYGTVVTWAPQPDERFPCAMHTSRRYLPDESGLIVPSAVEHYHRISA